MAVPSGASSISVTVRVRPFTIREAAQLVKDPDGTLFLGEGSLAGVPSVKLGQKGIRSVIKVIDDKCLVFDPKEDSPMQRFSRSVVPNMGKKVKDQTFGFDRVFDDNTTQGDVYESTTRCLLDSVLDGYNATVFAYGATGCGKTHTITGTPQQPGIIFLTMQELFEKIADRSDEKVTEVSLSYLEIYNETIRDLLVPGGSKQGLMLREDANQTVSVAGLTSHHPKNVQEVMDMIVTGNAYRTVSPTEANATSSRSHAVLQINVAQKDRNADVNEPHTMATLSIIDLAGSERASATKNRGPRLTEGANINKSLLALGSCINALCDPRKSSHVPYRNSKLTRLLKFSLGGNCKTVMIVCISPSSIHYDETQNTLRYANRAKNIQTKVTRNVFNVNRHVKDFLVKIDEQIALINELKAQQKDYEAVAFVKFKKQAEKREDIVKEGIGRIRAAFENSAPERLEKLNTMKRLRQVERRIQALSAWIAAFDGVCQNREDEQMPDNLATMRKTAQGIQLELEGSRQHLHQRLNKINWERAIDSALQSGIRQITEADGVSDSYEISSLSREAELLKINSEREAYREVSEFERNGDVAVMQALLSAHFDAISSINDILAMGPDQAVKHAKTILGRLMQACSTATSQIIKPDGSLSAGVAFPPTKKGTPKRKKQTNFLDGEARNGSVPFPLPINAPRIFASPIKSSPRRRRAVVAKKGVSFTPKKRMVRWRDDADAGTLADFEKTPKKFDASPEQQDSTLDQSLILPKLSSLSDAKIPGEPSEISPGSSPIPVAPESTLDIKPKNKRFERGFLSKKTSADPLAPPEMSSLSSDSEGSPLRLIDPFKASNRSPLSRLEAQGAASNDNSSEGENIAYQTDRIEGAKIRKHLKRASITKITHPAAIETTKRRTRSPTTSGSPPSESSLFTAGQARRMVQTKRDEAYHATVLSPRTVPIHKSSATRRTTVGNEGRGGSSTASHAVRMGGNNTIGHAPKGREPLTNLKAGGSSNGWR